MAIEDINIVSFDVPYPPDYGGVIDVYYKIKALASLGVNVHLHCYDYGRGERSELMRYCKSVQYYRRNTGVISNLSLTPYIIHSRRSSQLQENLGSNTFPIVFEGLHSAYPIIKKQLGDRQILLRSHNVEHDYYFELATRERNIFKKAYFYKEAILLKRFLSRLPPSLRIGAISPSDTEYLRQRFPNTFWLPPFHSSDAVNILPGKGDYALYHGNLSVSENFEMANLLISQFTNKNIILIIAGKDPLPSLIEKTQSSSNIELVINPDQTKMLRIIRNAQVILLPTSQSTGIKLKLVESLFNGRFCVANHAMVRNTGLKELVIREETDFYSATYSCFDQRFSASDITLRKEKLQVNYRNRNNAELLMNSLL